VLHVPWQRHEDVHRAVRAQHLRGMRGRGLVQEPQDAAVQRVPGVPGGDVRAVGDGRGSVGGSGRDGV